METKWRGKVRTHAFEEAERYNRERSISLKQNVLKRSKKIAVVGNITMMKYSDQLPFADPRSPRFLASKIFQRLRNE